MVADHGQSSFAVEFTPGQIIRFTYTNWQGVVAERKAQVISLVYEGTEWHPEPQWLLQAFDVEKNAVRLFALRDMVPSSS
jgi:predicted DNA-binding transcriptional regulator YafY